MTITDSKLMHPEFKFWRDLYTTLNKSENIIISDLNPSEKLLAELGETKKAVKIILAENPFYILTGKLFGSTEFIKWIYSGKTVSISAEDLKNISKVLKKNYIEIEYTDDYFKFSFNEKQDDDTLIRKDVYLNAIHNSPSITKISNKIDNIESSLNVIKELDSSYFKDDIFEIFLHTDNAVSTVKSNDKLLEIPTARLLPYINKPETVYYVSYSDKNKLGQRYVKVISSTLNEKINIELEQTFLTI